MLVLVGWCALCVAIERRLVPWLAARCGGDPVSGALAASVEVYCRLLHRVRFAGCEGVRGQTFPGPLIVVSNHGAGIDPLLIQSGMQAHIRWMMERRMMVPALGWLWRHERMIPVDFGTSDARAAITAIRHVQEGGVLGIFPEGGLARPPGRIQPFLPGVGLIVARSKAPVLLCWISGTPQRERAYDSLFTPSRSRVEFVELVSYPPRTRPEEIADDLRRRLAEASGWPLAESSSMAPAHTTAMMP